MSFVLDRSLNDLFLIFGYRFMSRNLYRIIIACRILEDMVDGFLNNYYKLSWVIFMYGNIIFMEA